MPQQHIHHPRRECLDGFFFVKTQRNFTECTEYEEIMWQERVKIAHVHSSGVKVGNFFWKTHQLYL